MFVIDVCAIQQRFEAVSPFLDERGRRLVAAAEALSAGYGGIAAVATATGVAPSTIGRGLEELSGGEDLLAGRVRRLGAGRKPTVAKDATLLSDLEALVEPTTRGDPESPLRWTCKSLRRLAAALQAQGHAVSHTLVGEILKDRGFSLQGNRKTTEGASHPDRDAQFGYINTEVKQALAENQPAISLVGGREGADRAGELRAGNVGVAGGGCMPRVRCRRAGKEWCQRPNTGRCSIRSANCNGCSARRPRRTRYCGRRWIWHSQKKRLLRLPLPRFERQAPIVEAACERTQRARM